MAVTEPTIALRDYLRKMQLDLDPDFLRQGVELLTQLLMEAEVAHKIGAERGQHSAERLTYRNGYREREWQTRLGEINLRIPRLRTGSYFPSFLEPRRRAEQALLTVIQTAYVEGVSTRRVDELLQALGLTGIDKSSVSRICAELDEAVSAFRNRALESEYPYVWLDALYIKVRSNHRIVSMALVIAMGIRRTGEREVLGLDLGASEEAAFWTGFLRSLVSRGLKGVKLVISDAHSGLKEAIRTVLSGAGWQRCRVHWTRNVLAYIPKRDKAMVAAAIRTIFAQPDQAAAKRQLEEVAKTMEQHWPKAAEVLRGGAEEVLEYMSFPPEHWTRLYSTNVLERLNREVRRRSDVAEVFPNREAAIRLAGSVLIEIDDEWQVDKRRYFSSDSMRKLYGELVELDAGHPLQLAPLR